MFVSNKLFRANENPNSYFHRRFPLQESQAEYKSEYHAGETVAMAGAREPHNAIVSNLIYLLQDCLWKGKCRVYPSDLLISLPECEKFVYADVTIVCEKVQLGEQKYGIDVLLNPGVVIEVFSESTELYDRVEKFACYRTLIKYVAVRFGRFKESFGRNLYPHCGKRLVTQIYQ